MEVSYPVSNEGVSLIHTLTLCLLMTNSEGRSAEMRDGLSNRSLRREREREVGHGLSKCEVKSISEPVFTQTEAKKNCALTVIYV